MQLIRKASFSRCKQYRYSLSRRWQHGAGRCVFIGLNPSTANASVDDPTIRRCMTFTKDWGYQELVVVNLFAYRTPDPAILMRCPNPTGIGNRKAIRQACQSADLIVAAWGNHGAFHNQTKILSGLLATKQVMCFGMTKKMQPVHPLYQRRDAQLLPFHT